MAKPANPSSTYTTETIVINQQAPLWSGTDRNVKKLIDVQVGDVITLGNSESSHHNAWNQCLVVDKQVKRISDDGDNYLYIKLERPYLHYSGTVGIAYIGLERFELIKSLPGANDELCHYHI